MVVVVLGAVCRLRRFDGSRRPIRHARHPAAHGLDACFHPLFRLGINAKLRMMERVRKGFRLQLS